MLHTMDEKQMSAITLELETSKHGLAPCPDEVVKPSAIADAQDASPPSSSDAKSTLQ